MAGTTLTGSGSVEIDSLELEVRFVFKPEKDGEQWTAETLLKKLGEKRVAPPPSPKALEELLQKLARVREAQSVVLLRGQPPEPPTPERVTWADLPVPPDLTALAEAAVAAAGVPEIYCVRTEKIKRETVVKKPAALPFLPPKEEVVVTYEKLETKEKVFVDGAVQDTAYADRDAKVGMVAPPKPGKPGKSVFGKPVPPRSEGEGFFLLGSGLIRDKSEIRAAASGVVRIGDGWADLIPLARPAWRVEKGGTTYLLHFEPGDKRLALPSAADILASVVSQGARPEDLISDADLAAALSESSRTGVPLAAFSLSRRMDAEVRVDISSDKLRAQLYLHKGVAGAAPLELKAISLAIRNSGVRGFAAEKVKADILAFHGGPEIELKDYLLVEGKAPSRGKDKEIQVAVAFLEGPEREALLARISAVPELALDADEELGLARVAAGVRIAQVKDAGEGVPGVDVFGSVLPGLPGNDPDIRLYGGLALRGKDIVTEVAGVLAARRAAFSFFGQVLEYRDARISVSISEDAMQATVELAREAGAGRPLTAEAVSAALAAAGVVRGLDGAAVAEALRIALEGGFSPPIVVARGEPPVAGGGSSVKWLVTLPAAGAAVSIREDGRADYKNQNRFVSVAEGTALAEIVLQGAEGRAGFDVAGKVLDPEKAHAVSLSHDESVREEPTDRGVRLCAARTGELIFDGWNLKINSLHAVAGDVGPGTGNINFLGEVRVSGKICSGYAVLGGQDVLVAETAEGALISSGGKAVIGQGIIGAGKGVVRARKTIEAAFVEQATLLAVEDITIRNGCLACNVKTNGRLRLTGEKGHLIGGVCKARLGIEGANIGSERGSRTEISFGQDYLVMDQIEVTERETEKIKAALLDLDKRIAALMSAKASLDAARAEKVRLMKIVEKYGMRLFTLREKFEAHHGSEIRVRGTVFPGVVMESHGRYYEVKQKRSRVVFYFNREAGRIQEKPLQ